MLTVLPCHSLAKSTTVIPTPGLCWYNNHSSKCWNGGEMWLLHQFWTHQKPHKLLVRVFLLPMAEQYTMAEMYMVSTPDDVVHSKYCYLFILGKLFHLITLPYVSCEHESCSLCTVWKRCFLKWKYQHKSYNRTLLNIFTQLYKAESKINVLNHQYTMNFLNLYLQRNMNEKISIPQAYLYYLTLGEWTKW